MSEPLLKIISPDRVPRLRREAVDAATLTLAAQIVEDVRLGGESELRRYGEKFGDITPGAPLVLERKAFTDALERIDEEAVGLLERTAARIRAFAEAQKQSLRELRGQIGGIAAGHSIAAVERAACYAPGGRFPLISSVLMTVIPAKVAGVNEVWLASPKPTDAVLAAASLAGADKMLAVGGAQAIAAFAYGAGPIPACDAIVGPGNRWVTAAKQLVCGRVAIDMLAGPSELVVLADAGADPKIIAADLLAQAEHDADAVPILVSLNRPLIDAVNRELSKQLFDLPTGPTAREALANGFAVLTPDISAGVAICNKLAPEHLEVMVGDANDIIGSLKNYGSLFIGPGSAEVFGDYGAGPNHVLPTGGTARYAAGLSVFNFLRARTWLRVDKPNVLIDDAAAFARLEGLEAHARAAELRQEKEDDD